MAPAGASDSARSPRAIRPTACAGVYLESGVPADEGLGKGEYYWHEVIGTTVRGTDGADLGTVQDIYRIGDTEVFEVAGGTVAPFDLPAVRAFIRIFAPKRGEIVVDAGSLDLRPAKSTGAGSVATEGAATPDAQARDAGSAGVPSG